MRPWEMHRLTMRELALVTPDVDDVEIPEGADRMLEPPVPEALRGF